MAVIRKSFIVFFTLLLTGHSAFSQKKNFVIRTMDWGYKIVQGDSANPKKKYYFVVPIVSYKPETRWMLGLSFAHYFRAKKDDPFTRPSVIRVNFTYTQNNQWSVRPQFEIFTADNKYNLRGLFQYTKFLENYWGIGNGVPESNKELYTFNQYKANAKVTRLIRKGIYAGVQFNYEKLYNIGTVANSMMKASGVNGVNGYESLGAGPMISFDNRDHIYFPKKGHFVDVSTAVYNKAYGSSSNFTNITVDARKYISLWKENVLALQLYGNFNEGTVPFRLMGTVGSDSYMRGYYFGRYRDDHMIAAQAEFRKQIWGPVSMVLFGGAGNVANTINGLSDKVKPTYGFGVRFLAIPREKINMRFDYGRGLNGIEGIYLTLNEAF